MNFSIKSSTSGRRDLPAPQSAGVPVLRRILSYYVTSFHLCFLINSFPRQSLQFGSIFPLDRHSTLIQFPDLMMQF